MGSTATGLLSALFRGIVFKRLSAVEVNSTRSNQHEFNGSRPLVNLFGLEQPQRLGTDFYRLSDNGRLLSARGLLTWYDARARHPTRTEYRLYYYDNTVTREACEGDTLIIGRKLDGTTFLLTTSASGQAATRIAWLFGIEVVPGAAFAALDLDQAERSRLLHGLGGSVSNDEPPAWEAESEAVLADVAPTLRSAIRQLQRHLGTSGSSDSGERDW